MYTSLIAISALLASSALAAPTEKRQAHQAGITIQFIGGPASYSLWVPQDGTYVPTNSDLNISKLRSQSNIVQLCDFSFNPAPAEAAEATIVPSDDGAFDVGPPQAVVGVTCHA